MRKVVGVLLLWLALLSGAEAEIQLVPQAAEWDLSLPLNVTLSADVRTHMPFDDERCQQLNSLLKHLSLELQTSGSIGRTAVRVDGREALWMIQQTGENATQVQVSWQPGETYVGGEDAALALLGGEETDFSAEMNRLTWLEDGHTLLEGMRVALEPYGKQTEIKTKIGQMGVARTKITCTVPAEQAEVWKQAVQDAADEGDLKGLLSKLMFTGQQKLIFWLSQDGEILRAEYAGRCGLDEASLRKVSLIWRMCRTEDKALDDFTLKAPAASGNDDDTLTFSREMQQDKDGSVNLKADYHYSRRAGSQKTTFSGETDLKSIPGDEKTLLTGSIQVSQKLPGEDKTTSTLLKPELLLGQAGGSPEITGTLTVQKLSGKTVMEDAELTVQAGAGEYLLWLEPERTVEVSQALEKQEEWVRAMSAALVPHLVLLPQEDTLYLSADLPGETWQHIVEAAQAAHMKEVTP